MILKEANDRSHDIAELERLKAAAPASFHAAIQKQIGNIRAGESGERSAAHFIGREFRRSERVAVIHDLRIGTDGDYAQIDHLLIHRLQATAWVLETKNYSGRLSCDEHGDWTIWRNGKPQPVPSPINQAQRQCRALQIWLEANKINWIRQIQPVVLISPTSSVDRRKLPPDTHVVKSDNFTAWWKERGDAIGFGTALGMLSRHMISGMSHEEFEALGQRLVSGHVPASFDWRAKLHIPRAKSLAEACRPEQAPVQPHANVVAAVVPDSGAQIIKTPFGEIRIVRIPDGRYALRNDRNELLIEIVRKACRGRALWNPRFCNWLISGEKLSEILAAIERNEVSASND